MIEQQTEISGQQRPLNPRRVLLIAAPVAVAIAIAVVLYQSRPEMISPLGAILALMTCAIGMLPALFYVLRDEISVPFFQ